MMNRNRREFLADVGKGMLLTSVGSGVAAELGLAPSFAADGPERLLFGDRESLVGLMQDTPVDKLLPVLLEKLQGGAKLDDLVAAAALANARTFGGLDYEGHHCFAALLPSLQMSRELPEARRALPVFKVLYRNTSCIQGAGGSKKEALHPVVAADLPKGRPGSDLLRETFRKGDLGAAERTFAALTRGPIGEAYNDLQFCVHDEIDVHRVVLSWRAWATIDVVGKDQALTLLRQSVRFCVRVQDRPTIGIRAQLPKLLDQYKLLDRPPGNRRAEDARVDRLALTIYDASPAEAAEAAAAALAEGLSPEDVGEAISLASNRLVLCDQGRIPMKSAPEVPEGSVHGNSVGVHASDAANAWRNIARVTNSRNTFASLIVAAFQTCVRPEHRGPLSKEPMPLPAHLEKITAKDAGALLHDAEAAIRASDQAGAAALVQRYGELKLPERPVFDLLLRYACSEDGALHAEKYYRTVCEEFATTRPAFRWRQLVALARVTASEYGHPSPGYLEASRLMKV
ncbi:hypothetical protein [Fimbriiglobus ruber]|uniref:Uncharacterized protein n=1 Tax=Fimbriiglobus ruber TaxID=1908690 RepID=A0A225D5B4_9BACT|nr:hypothetical protein [Fimbriiglobus ruber]OWK34814.1 hypothetical protein FRUB_09656 [Fimbriiglobus ruber]